MIDRTRRLPDTLCAPARTDKFSRKGFTLIEVLLALAIFSIILTVLYSTFFLSHRAVSGMEESLLRLHELRVTLDVMQREMESALKSKAIEDPPFTVKDRDMYGRQTSAVGFTTLYSPLPGLSRVSYYVEETEGKLVLFKKLGSAWEDNAPRQQEGMEAPVIEDIGSFTVELKDNDSWVKTWIKTEMPKELRITITVPIRNRSLTLSQTVRPKTGSRI